LRRKGSEGMRMETSVAASEEGSIMRVAEADLK
jgi:hypothetical protein